MKLLLAALLTICLSFSYSFAEETRITPEFARQLLDWNKEDFEKEARLVDNALDNLNSHELRELLTLMIDDISKNGSGTIFSPPLPLEYRVGNRVVDNIKDRLGILEYNGVYEGRITRFDMPTTVYYCHFKPKFGPEFPMSIGSVLGPVGDAYNLEGQNIRVYVRQHPVGKSGDSIYALLKVEFLADDPDVNTIPQFPSPGNSLRGAKPR